MQAVSGHDVQSFLHGLRVHLQIITWKVIKNTEIELMPDEWRMYERQSIISNYD